MLLASTYRPALWALALVILLPLVASDAQAQHEARYSGELIVRLAPDATVQQLTSDPLLEEFGLEPIQNLVPLLNIWLVGFDEAGQALMGRSADHILAQVRSSEPVKLAQYNHEVHPRGEVAPLIPLMDPSGPIADPIDPPNDPMFSQMWGLHNTGQTGGTPGADIDALAAWAITTGGIASTGEQIVVAILDDGVDLNHPDLPLWKNEHESSTPNGIDDDGNGYIDDYHGWNAVSNNGNISAGSHGTHVAGTAAARGNNAVGVTGVNWNAAIMPIQVLGSGGLPESRVVAAYGYALTMRTIYNDTNGEMGAFVVATNASFGINNANPDNYPIWCGMYDELGQVGIVSTGATMNINANVDVTGDMPTACPSNWLISVTNTTHNDEKNSGAAYGLTTIELGAPGTGILSTRPNNNYGNSSGTSMATPHVTGAIALVVSSMSPGRLNQYRADPANVALQIRQAILDGTDYIGIQTVTGGRLNVHGALIQALEYDVPDLPEVAGGTSRAVAFDGTGVMEAGPSFRFPRTDELSLSMWAQVDGPGVLAELSSEETLSFRLEVIEDGDDLVLKYTHMDDDGNEASRVFNQRPLTNGTHHIALTRGEEIPAVRLILDGQRLGQPFFYTVEPSSDPQDKLFIGNSADGSAGVSAVVDEVRLYRDRMLLNDVQATMHHSFDIEDLPSSLVAYYRFEADTTGFAWDFSNSGNGADITNYQPVVSPFPVGESSTLLASTATSSGYVGEEGARLVANVSSQLGGGTYLGIYASHLGDGFVQEDDLPDGFVGRSEAIFGAYARGEVTASLRLEFGELIQRDFSTLHVLHRPDRTAPWTESGETWQLDGDAFTTSNATTFGQWAIGYTQYIGTEETGRGLSTSLAPAYPNPFRSNATLTLELETSGSVTVEVLDLLGRRVMVLHDGLMTADSHELRLDGSSLAPGMYLVRATGEGFSLVQRVTLVR